MATTTTLRATTAAELRNDAAEHERLLHNLDRTNKLLKQEVSYESRREKSLNRVDGIEEIRRLQDLGDEYTKRIEMEKRRIEVLEKQIADEKGKLNEQRQKMGGLNAAKHNKLVISKQIQVLENRIDKTLVRYNETLAKNKALKAQINDCRKERLIFDGIYRKLEVELETEKAAMESLIEECNEAYAERDKAKAKVAALKQEAAKEQEAFQLEWKKLSDTIEKEKRAKDLSELPDTGAKEKRIAMEEEARMRRSIAKGAWTIGKGKAQIFLSAEKMQHYEEAFNKIQQTTGVTDIDELVQRFIASEDKNFSLFNYVNELAAEIDNLEQQIQAVKQDIEKYRGQGVNTDNQRKRILRELQQRLERTNAKADNCEKNYEDSVKVLKRLAEGISKLFEGIGCSDKDMHLEILGNEGVNESNMMQYLGIIEQRANEILHSFAATQPEGLVAIKAFLKGNPTMEAGASTIHSDHGNSNEETAPVVVEPPEVEDSMKDNGSDDEEVERPLSVRELQESVQRDLGDPSYTA